MSASTAPAPASGFALRYSREDPERRLGLPSGRFTNPSAMTALLLALVALGIVYGGLYPLRERPGFATAWLWLTGFSGIPIPMAFLAAWSTSILVLKGLKIRAQRRAFLLRFLPADPGFVVSSASAERVIAAVETSVEEPERFMYLARVLRALPADAFGRAGHHNVTGRVTLRDLLATYTEHLDHHLGFLAQKRERVGKPLRPQHSGAPQ